MPHSSIKKKGIADTREPPIGGGGVFESAGKKKRENNSSISGRNRSAIEKRENVYLSPAKKKKASRHDLGTRRGVREKSLFYRHDRKKGPRTLQKEATGTACVTLAKGEEKKGGRLFSASPCKDSSKERNENDMLSRSAREKRKRKPILCPDLGSTTDNEGRKERFLSLGTERAKKVDRLVGIRRRQTSITLLLGGKRGTFCHSRQEKKKRVTSLTDARRSRPGR